MTSMDNDMAPRDVVRTERMRACTKYDVVLEVWDMLWQGALRRLRESNEEPIAEAYLQLIHQHFVTLREEVRDMALMGNKRGREE